MVAIQEIYQEFMELYHSRYEMIAGCAALCQKKTQPPEPAFSQSMHRAIVETGFMRLYLAWESFLERAFISYLQNACDLQHRTYSRYAQPTSDQHAYDMLRGSKTYPDWTNIDEVNRLARVFFKDAGPFAMLAAPPAEFLEMKTIRNRIAHVSEKSQRQFDTLLSKKIAQIGIAPGDYLMMFKAGKETYFTYYAEMIRGYVEAICNQGERQTA